MSRTYLPENLRPINPKSADCALAWVRLFLRDKPDPQENYPETGLEDDEYLSFLELDAARDGQTRYYRPHVTAASILKSDPYRAETFNVDGFTKGVRSADKIADAWAQAGAEFDRQIPEHLLANAEAEVLAVGL